MSKRHTAPHYLPADQKAAWNKRYDSALGQAKVNLPDDAAGQHTSALKEANKMLTVKAPTTAAEIDALDGWQVLKRDTVIIDNVEHRTCVTLDGRKYVHPVRLDVEAAFNRFMMETSGGFHSSAEDWTTVGRDAKGFPVVKGSKEDVSGKERR